MLFGQNKIQTQVPTSTATRITARQFKHDRTRSGPGLELLEQRFMMDGNVTVGLRSGFLVVSGDTLDNQVEISQPTPGTIHVEGLDGTTVNGRGFAEVTGLVRSVTIQLRQGGDDQVTIQGPVAIAADLRASLGDGELTIEGSAGPVEIGRNLAIRAGENGNVTMVNAVSVEGATNIRAGGEVVAASGLTTLPDFDAASFSDSLTIDNPYFPVVPGTTWTYEAEGIDDETGEPLFETNVVEVLTETRTILGVEVRIVRDRVFVEGRVMEDTFDWYAQDDNGNVWYLGEDVSNFEYDADGNLIGTNHDGHWEAGVDGGTPGTIMQADPRIGDRYYQEFQPGGVLDHAEVLSRDETIDTALGTFSNVLRTKDVSVREPFGLAHKVYAPGLGVIGEFKFDIEDDEILETTRLVSVELNGVSVTELVPPDGFTGTNATGEAKEGIDFDGALSIRAGGAVLLNGTELEDHAQINSDAEVIIIDSLLSESSWIVAAEVVTFRNASAEERVWIRSDGDVYIFDSALDDIKILFGPSDNSLIVEGSEISRLFADGGPGTNTFEDRGGNTIGQLQLTRF